MILPKSLSSNETSYGYDFKYTDRQVIPNLFTLLKLRSSVKENKLCFSITLHKCLILS